MGFWTAVGLREVLKKAKNKVVHAHALKVCRGNRGIAPLILKLGTR